MNNSHEINENEVKIEKNSNNIDEISSELPVEIEEKIETKGLKLKKSTKDRLNLLQSSFDDAESMVVALLNQYEVFALESDDRFADRKSEIERFNFLIESIKGCFVNSLEMATYIEEKCTEKIKGEIKKKDKVISLLQEENASLKNKFKNTDLEIAKKIKELSDVKDSFSRVNLALTTVEKELSEKSSVIQNLQLHIKSLTEMSQDNKEVKLENEKLKEVIKELEEKLTKVNIDNEKLVFLKSENERYINEIKELQKEKNEYKEYSNSLNMKIQEILIEKSNEINSINNERNVVIMDLENRKNSEIREANNTISKLKDELYELKLNISKKEIEK